MKNEWILDVLDDLTAFAKVNGMPSLAEQLADTSLLAACELASVSAGGAVSGAKEADSIVQRDFGGSRASL